MLTLSGEIKTIILKTKDKDGKILKSPIRIMQIETVNEDGYKKFIDVTDFDLTRKVELNKQVSLPVYAQIWIGENSKGEKSAPVIQYHAIKGNQEVNLGRK
jgi:hypothetical protein